MRQRKAAQIPLEAIHFTPEEKQSLIRQVEIPENQLGDQASFSSFQRNPAQTQIWQDPHEGMINFRGQWYDPSNALHADELQNMGYSGRSSQFPLTNEFSQVEIPGKLNLF
jgi:hypothetical protein